jgi:4-amino-4-deoxy-L-arabinose transferase-like glycosyltransferase
VSKRTMHWALALTVSLYLVLGVVYSLVNPVFESPDEALNYANIRYLVEERRLPVLEPGEPTKAHHPPLYYVLGALLTSWVPDENFAALVARENPFWAYRSWEYGVDNKSLYLHDPELEGFPYRDTALGVHLVRWLSLLMGAGTVLCVFETTREIFPQGRAVAVGAAALVAFNPMFLFISASVHDDALANLVAAGTLFLTARILVRGATAQRAATLGLLVGLAILTKLTCLLVVPTAALALLYRSLVERGRTGWRDIVRLGGVVALAALLVGGWWFVRNILLYGEPTSMGRQTGVWGVRENAPDVLAAVRELGFTYDSFWGVFGYGQIPMPRWTYGLVRLLGMIALGGLTLFCVRRRAGNTLRELPPAVILILMSAFLVALAVNFVRMTVSAAADFGRYLYVSLAVLAPLYTLGLSEWFGRTSSYATFGLATLLFALAVFALVGVLWPAYAPPVMLSIEQIQARTRPTDLRFGDSIRLVGYDVGRTHVLPGEDVTVTLCWETLEPMAKDYVYFVHLLGPEENVVGARDTHPGLGRYPTSRWLPGEAFCDAVRVPVKEWAPAPAVYDIAVGWHLYKEGEVGEHLPAYNSADSLLELVTLGKLKVRPEAYAAVAAPNRLDVDLGEQVTLLGYDVDRLSVAPGESVNITLYWAAQAPIPADYTVFVHLAAPQSPPRAQDDCQPQRGSYPTSFWDVGEVVADPHTIIIPPDLLPGEYRLVAGMYLLETGERLSADAIQLTALVVRSELDEGVAP